MKHVFKNSMEVAHIFAQRLQSDGRCTNLFFEKDTIYSYGHHYTAAKFYDRKGKTILLINSHKYSVTTASHLGDIRMACSQYKQIECPIVDLGGKYDIKERHKKNLEYFQSEIERYAALAMSARKNGEMYLSYERGIIANGNRYKEFFGLGKKKFVSMFNTKKAKELIEKSREQSKQDRERKKQREALEFAEKQQNLAGWLANEYNGHNLPGNTQFLRMKDAETVETSKYVDFPLSHAKLALAKIRQCVNKGTPWHRNGQEIRVGTFHIDSIDEQGNVIAGCHNIKYEEIKRFAQLHNL